MCGFVSFINTPRVGNDPAPTLRKMTDRIKHRGPDDVDYYTDNNISIGFRRLSIIDLEGGRQPVLNEDGSKVLVFNGEIYNFKSLRQELINAGHTFKSHSDSEVLLHGYEQYGAEILHKIRGMYAFAIWDTAEKRIFGARDIFGVKPLYYYHHDGEFLLASEIKCFLDHPGFKKELDEERIPEYLSYEYIPYENTLFKNVYNIPGGHYFEYKNDQMQVHEYCDISYNPDNNKSLSFWEEAISKEFSESIEVHQISDVEVGCFLSSGVDSSYVVSEVSKGTDKVKTFSVGYEEEKYSELPFAQALSKELGVENISNKISADDFFSAMPEIQYYMDEPLPNPSAIPLYFLAKNANKYVKVVLSGEGADELFGGYPMYLAGGHFHRYSKRVPRGIRRAIGSLANRLPDFKGKNFLVRGAMEPYRRFMRANYVFQADERQKFLKKPISSLPPQEYSKRYFDKVSYLDEPTQLQYADIHTWMLYDINLKADRMSMANSLELRVPFLDKKLLALSSQIPTKYKAHNETTKIALRSAALKSLPEKTANKKKLGFPVPLTDWLKQDKYYNIVRLAFQSSTSEKFFVTCELLKLLDDHKSGKALNMQKIWSFYTFIIWYDQFFTEV